MSSIQRHSKDDIFSYKGLRNYLTHCLECRPIFALGDYTGQPGMILRHDIDLDLAAAERVSNIEGELGIRSSYFFLVTTESYNILSRQGRALLRDLDRRGFEVGLHFDPTIYPEAPDPTLQECARTEAAIIESVIGKKIQSVSLHNPSLHGNFISFEGWKNSYSSEIFSPSSYISDSRMTFQKDPYDFVRSCPSNTIQVLLHPMHYSENAARYPAPMLSFIEDQIRNVDRMFQENSAYREGQFDIWHELKEKIAKRVRK